MLTAHFFCSSFYCVRDVKSNQFFRLKSYQVNAFCYLARIIWWYDTVDMDTLEPAHSFLANIPQMNMISLTTYTIYE